LNLKNKQDREIIYVLMYCCSQEQSWNDYYTHLASRLCTFNYNFKFTFQYHYWDKFKELATMAHRCSTNLALLLAHLVGNFSLSLSILKTVDFTTIQPDPPSLAFFRTFFHALLMKLPKSGEAGYIRSIFDRIANQEELETLRDQILLFFQSAREEIIANRLETAENQGLQKKEEEDELYLKRMKEAKKAMQGGDPGLL